MKWKFYSDWLYHSGFLTFYEAATKEKLSLDISMQVNICRAFFKLKMKTALLHPQLMPTQVWLKRKGDPALCRITSPWVPFSPALAPAWTSHDAALPSLDMGPVSGSHRMAAYTHLFSPLYGRLAGEPAYSPLDRPQMMSTGKVVKKRVLFLGCHASPPPLLPLPAS